MVLPPSNKLSEATTKPAQNGKINDVHVKICRPKCIELVAMAASIYDETKPNSRLVFAGQAIRKIREKYINLATSVYVDSDVVITLVLINSHDYYYTAEQRAAIKNSVEKIKQENSVLSRVTIRMVILSTLSQITQYINQGRDYLRQTYPIGRIDIFSHGAEGSIMLAYKLTGLIEDDDGELKQAQGVLLLNRKRLMKWNPKAFSATASFYSWACRTGGLEDKNSRNNTFAHYIAFHLNIPVYAFIRRTEYANTWGSRGDRMILRTQCNIPVVGNTDRCEQLIEENKNRRENVDNTGATWMENGAVYPVTTGSSPEEDPKGMFVYYPRVQEPKQVTNE